MSGAFWMRCAFKRGGLVFRLSTGTASEVIYVRAGGGTDG